MISEKKLISFYLLFYFMLLFSGYFSGKKLFVLSCYLLGGLGFVYFLCLKKNQFKIYKKYLLLLIVMGIIAMQTNHNLSWQSLLIQMSYIGIALLLLYSAFDYRCAQILFLGIWLFCTYYYLKNRTLTGLFMDTSVNYVSVLYIVLLFLLAISYDQRNKYLSLWYVAAASVFCILAGGRSGILAIGICFAVKVVVNISYSKKKYVKTVGIIAVIVLFILLLLILQNEKMIELLFVRFYTLGMSDSRALFWKNYLFDSSQSMIKVLFGANISESLQRYHYRIPNLHNSYLMEYGLYGIFMLFVNFFYIFKALCYFVKEKKYELFTLSVVFLIRSLTDLLFGNYYGDIFWFYLIFTGISKEKEKIHKRIGQYEKAL